MSKSLNELAKELHATAKEKGFYEGREFNLGEKLMLVTSELGEALEADRKGNWARLNKDDRQKVLDNMEAFFENSVKDTFEDEIADVFIRLLDLVGFLKIDIDFYIEAKSKYNAQREKKHGKKY